jgi:hypothetical protein
MLSLSMTPGLPFYDIYLMGGGKARQFMVSYGGIFLLLIMA